MFLHSKETSNSKQKQIVGLSLAPLIFLFLLHALPAFGAGPADEKELNHRQLAEILTAQKTELSRELGKIKREIALLKEAADKPGITEIIGGIGYILGLFGISYYWYARNLIKNGKE